MNVKHVMDMTEQPEWIDRAEKLLTDALYKVRAEDVITTVTEALAALYLSVGEPRTVVVDPADYRDYVREKDEYKSAVECSCLPGLVARGGWQSRCSAHGAR
jgi:hypothetical protein